MSKDRSQAVRQLFLELVRPSPAHSQSTRERLCAHGEDWNAVCDLAHQFGLVTLIYERCRSLAISPPPHVCEWMEIQHMQIASTNTILLDELNTIISALSARGIPALVLKGPVLAHLSTGLLVRPFHDLDLLIKPRDTKEAAATLQIQGYWKVDSVRNHYHDIFVKPGQNTARVVEMHFDLADRGRSYTPDVAGLWDRSMCLNLRGHATRTLSLSDHLLVAMIQLPHHHWHLRLLAEMGAMVDRWQEVIDWDALIERANEWGMRALAGSALHVVGSLFRVALPERITGFAQPENYFRRVQWQLVQHAVLDQIAVSRPKTGQLASLLLLDRFSDVISLVGRKASLADHADEHPQTVSAGFRHLAAATSNLPLLLRLAAEAAIPRSPNARRWSPRVGVN
jgi:hypothetical protein